MKATRSQDRESSNGLVAGAGQRSGEPRLSGDEQSAAKENSGLSPLTVYSIVLREGKHELRRPVLSLWWSGVAAGFCISASVLAQAVFRTELGAESGSARLIESLGYSLGFLLVILGRLQLFTENTITVVLPLLASPSRNALARTARLWLVVLLANFAGTFLAALVTVKGGLYPEDVLASVLAISHHVAAIPPIDAFLRGMPAGFLIAAIVWMLPSAKGNEALVIIVFTWLISAGGFTHVVAGSHEVFCLVVHGELTMLAAFSNHIAPVLLGNIIGGTGLFALLAYGQVREEMQ